MKKKTKRILAVLTLVLLIMFVSYFGFTCSRFNFSFDGKSLENAVFRSDNDVLTLVFDGYGNAVYTAGEFSISFDTIEVLKSEFSLISENDVYKFAVLGENEILCLTYGKKLQRIGATFNEEN